ncbi:MAG: hypothetical protein JXR63_11795, partial [Spirochaetales bacterium]|nr:hypothetical protein [Spirochaetales bacterium]
ASNQPVIAAEVKGVDEVVTAKVDNFNLEAAARTESISVVATVKDLSEVEYPVTATLNFDLYPGLIIPDGYFQFEWGNNTNWKLHGRVAYEKDHVNDHFSKAIATEDPGNNSYKNWNSRYIPELLWLATDESEVAWDLRTPITASTGRPGNGTAVSNYNGQPHLMKPSDKAIWEDALAYRGDNYFTFYHLMMWGDTTGQNLAGLQAVLHQEISVIPGQKYQLSAQVKRQTDMVSVFSENKGSYTSYVGAGLTAFHDSSLVIYNSIHSPVEEEDLFDQHIKGTAGTGTGVSIKNPYLYDNNWDLFDSNGLVGSSAWIGDSANREASMRTSGVWHNLLLNFKTGVEDRIHIGFFVDDFMWASGLREDTQSGSPGVDDFQLMYVE